MTDTTLIEAPAHQAPSINPLAAITTLQAPDRASVMRPAETAAIMAQLLTVTTPIERELAVEELQSIKTALKELDKRRRTVTDPLYQAMTAVNALFKPATIALEDAESIIKDKVLAFDQAEAVRIEKERRDAEEVARKQAAAAAMAAAQVAAQAEAAAQAAQMQAQAAADAGKHEEAAAHELSAAAAQAQAAEVVATAALASFSPPATTVAVPLKKGTSTRTKWTAALVDLHALVQHVAENPSLIGLVQINQNAADKMASALEAQMAIPGLKPICSQSLALRRT